MVSITQDSWSRRLHQFRWAAIVILSVIFNLKSIMILFPFYCHLSRSSRRCGSIVAPFDCHLSCWFATAFVVMTWFFRPELSLICYGIRGDEVICSPWAIADVLRYSWRWSGLFVLCYCWFATILVVMTWFVRPVLGDDVICSSCAILQL